MQRTYSQEDEPQGFYIYKPSATSLLQLEIAKEEEEYKEYIIANFLLNLLLKQYKTGPTSTFSYYYNNTS